MSTSTSPPHHPRNPDDGHYIYRACRTCSRTGKTLWARNYGKRAWPIWVPNDTGQDGPDRPQNPQ